MAAEALAAFAIGNVLPMVSFFAAVRGHYGQALIADRSPGPVADDASPAAAGQNR